MAVNAAYSRASTTWSRASIHRFRFRAKKDARSEGGGGASSSDRALWGCLGSYVDVVFNLRDAGRGPGGALGFVFFRPRTHAAIELDCAAFRFHRHATGVNFSAAFESLFDLALDLCWRNLRFHRDVIRDADHSSQFLHR